MSNAPTTTASAEKLIRLPRVLELTGRGRTATLDDVRAGAFPQPIKLGAATVWLESEVQAWIAERVRQAREAGTLPHPVNRGVATVGLESEAQTGNADRVRQARGAGK